LQNIILLEERTSLKNFSGKASKSHFIPKTRELFQPYTVYKIKIILI
jgi:hypothetical protein